MGIIELNEKEFYDFVINNSQCSFYQLPQWGQLKKINGWNPYILGYKQNKKIVAACLLLEKNTPIKKKIFYSPRGFIIDYNNFDLLNNFTQDIKNFIKKKNGFMLKIDPYVIYQTRDKNGEKNSNTNDSAINNLKRVGFKHFGFNKEFETMQPRFVCRFELKEDYKTTIESFAKSTRKHLIEVDNLGVIVKKADKDEIKIAVDLLDETAKRKSIATRPSSYYEKMKECLDDNVDFFICYLDKKESIDKIKLMLKEEEKNKNIILEKMKVDKVGKKLTNKLETSNNKINALNEKIEFINNLKEDRTYIGSLLSTWTGEEGTTVLSGTNDKFKKFLPKYAFYNAHIKEAINKKKKYVNFYGISGIFDENDKNYGIYEVKKGFNPEVIELIGEFDLKINKFWYLIYKISFKLYKMTK